MVSNNPNKPPKQPRPPVPDDVAEAIKRVEYFVSDLQFDGDKRQFSDDVDLIIRAASKPPVKKNKW